MVMTRSHRYNYGDVPGVGECNCGALRVWDRESRQYKFIEGEGE